MSRRSPYSSAALMPGAFIAPRACGSYPLDLDGSLRYTRPASGVSMHPYPPIIGYIQGLLPMQDGLVFAGAYGKNAFGPWTASAQVAAAGAIFQKQDTKAITPELPKVEG